MPSPETSWYICNRITRRSGFDVSPAARVKDLLYQLTKLAVDHGPGADESEYLDERTRALVVLAAAVCSDSSTRTLTSLVKSALQAGVTEEQVLGVLFTVAPAAGESRVVAVTPRISKALGYDIHQVFERG